MQIILQKSLLILLCAFVIVLTVGCQQQKLDPIQSQKTERLIGRARVQLETVENLGTKDTYPNDFTEAKIELTNAEAALKMDNLDGAYDAAMRSLSASQRILKQFYIDTVAKLAQNAKDEIHEVTEKDPENPLEEFLPKLDNILEYSKDLESDIEIVSVNKVIEDLDQVIEINYSTETIVSETLSSDISFEKGEYELSEEGKLALQDIVGKILKNKEDYQQQHSKKTIVVKVKAVGYTDQVGFRPGTELIRNLTEGCEDKVPEDRGENRKFLNQRLSFFRARTISEQFKTEILEADAESVIEDDVVGLGEDLPPDVPEPYPTNDPRRRICKIYSYVVAR